MFSNLSIKVRAYIKRHFSFWVCCVCMCWSVFYHWCCYFGCCWHSLKQLPLLVFPYLWFFAFFASFLFSCIYPLQNIWHSMGFFCFSSVLRFLFFNPVIVAPHIVAGILIFIWINNGALFWASLKKIC